jgi:hypothetical protein
MAHVVRRTAGVAFDARLEQRKERAPVDAVEKIGDIELQVIGRGRPPSRLSRFLLLL